jgi:hypothetical protein
MLERTGALVTRGEPIPAHLEEKLKRLTAWSIQMQLLMVSEDLALSKWPNPDQSFNCGKPGVRARAEKLIAGARYLKRKGLDVGDAIEEAVRHLHLFDDVPECNGPGCFKGRLHDSGWYGEHPDSQDGWPCPFCDGTGFLFNGAKGYDW